MKYARLVATLVLIGLCPTRGTTQDPDKARAAALQFRKTHCPLRILPGYKYQVVQGVEDTGFEIWKEGGARILDVTNFNDAMTQHDPITDIKQQDILWRQEQSINNYRFLCVRTKSNELRMSFPEKQVHYLAIIHNEKDLADVLLMVMTEDFQHLYPVDPAILVDTK
jgi:hypothetical protein